MGRARPVGADRSSVEARGMRRLHSRTEKYQGRGSFPAGRAVKMRKRRKNGARIFAPFVLLSFKILAARDDFDELKPILQELAEIGENLPNRKSFSALLCVLLLNGLERFGCGFAALGLLAASV